MNALPRLLALFLAALPVAGTGCDDAALNSIAPASEQVSAEEEPSREIAVAMCSNDEPGERLEFFGKVLDENGRPLEGASVIAYSTDATGLYTLAGSEGRYPRIRAVAVTNRDGWYRFRTIKPGPYPSADDPEHIHMHVDAPVHAHMYRTLWFEGDPRLTGAKRSALDSETVIVTLRKRSDGVWTVRHDIRLKGA